MATGMCFLFLLLVVLVVKPSYGFPSDTNDINPDADGIDHHHVPGAGWGSMAQRDLSDSDTAFDAHEMAIRTLDHYGVPREGPYLHNGSYYEIDVRMTEEQHNYLYGVGSESNRSKRKAVIGDKYRWTDKTLVYEFQPGDFTQNQIDDIKEAMKVYSDETCMKFREATPSDVNKVHFQQGQGCNSDLGMTGGTQVLNLDRGGCRYMGLYWHEIGHALGLVHEHQLPERDDYIKVHFKNIKPDFRRWFMKYKDTELVRHGVPYDITSVMHYEQRAFSLDGSPSIEVKEKNKDHWVGRVFMKMLSFSDVKIVNKMYSCDAGCRNVRCPEEGFVNKECKCITPQSYYDSHCKNSGLYADKDCDLGARQGVCWTRERTAFHCRKSCDYCPKFGIDVPHIKGDCVNKYTYEEKCNAWAAFDPAQNICDDSSSKNFMHRYCSKACGTCAENIGKCLNTYESDMACDIMKEKGECESPKLGELTKTQCADSCGTCGYSMVKGYCTNVWGDSRCERVAMDGDCDHEDVSIAIETRKNCERSCNTCGFGKGNCANIEDDKKCDEWAARAECDVNIKWMRTNCAKSCNSCGFGTRGQCQNARGSYFCNHAADQGSCTDVSPGWYRLFCASACNTCGWPSNGCADALPTQQCQEFKKRGDCETNPGYSFYNCAKTCNTCDWLTTDIPCKNMMGDALCATWQASGECEHNKFFMESNCRKACNICDRVDPTFAPIVRGPCKNTGAITEERCDAYAERGDCKTHEGIRYDCRSTCNTCDAKDPTLPNQPPPTVTPVCENRLGDEMCKYYVVADRCQNDKSTQRECRKMCGLC